MDSEVKFGLDNSFTSNESGSASDSVLSTPWESEALTRPSLIQVDFSSIKYVLDYIIFFNTQIYLSAFSDSF